MGGEGIVASSLRKKRHRGKKWAGGIETGCVGHNMTQSRKCNSFNSPINLLNSLNACWKNFLNGLVGTRWNRSPTCVTRDGDRWSHKEINVSHTWHLGYIRDGGREDWGSEKFINFTKIIQQWSIHIWHDWTQGCLSPMSIVFSLFDIMHKQERIFLSKANFSSSALHPVVVIVVTIYWVPTICQALLYPLVHQSVFESIIM